MCPICVTSPTHRSRSRFVLLADHIATAHDDGSTVGDEDILPSSLTNPTRGPGNEEVCFDSIGMLSVAIIVAFLA